MATRSRTVLFIQYRQSFSRTNRRPQNSVNPYDTSESAGLLGDRLQAQNSSDVLVEMSELPPRWIDVVADVDSGLTKLRERVTQLEQLHKKHLLPGFEDDMKEEAAIERMTDEITKRMAELQRKIKKVEHATIDNRGVANADQQKLGKNIQMSLAQKLHDITSQFRKEQNVYLQKLRGRETQNAILFNEATAALANDTDNYDFETGMSDAQLAQLNNNENVIKEREKAINEILKSIHAVANVFQELNTMVIDQGTVLDRIDYNIDMVATHLEDAVKELDKGAAYQKKSSMRLIIIVLMVCVAVMIVILIVRRNQRAAASTPSNPSTSQPTLT